MLKCSSCTNTKHIRLVLHPPPPALHVVCWRMQDVLSQWGSALNLSFFLLASRVWLTGLRCTLAHITTVIIVLKRLDCLLWFGAGKKKCSLHTYKCIYARFSRIWQITLRFSVCSTSRLSALSIITVAMSSFQKPSRRIGPSWVCAVMSLPI